MKRKMILAGFALFILTASSQAQEWFQVTSGTNKKLNTIDFPSATVGYIGGNDSLLLKTVDGGQNWSPVNYTGITFLPGGEHIINLQFITENIGFIIVGPYSGSYKTIDGGLSWTAITALNTCYNQGLFFFDEQNGFIGGSGCFQGELIDQLNGGVWSPSTVTTSTWDAQNMIVDIEFSDANNGLAVSRSGYVLRTTDGGANWDTIPTPGAPMNPLTSILIVNTNLAYAGYESINSGFGLYISTDNGLTWQEDINSATFLYPDFIALHASGDGSVYSGGNSSSMTSGVIFDSPGDGITWNYSIVDEQINGISSYNDTMVFAVGDSGYIVVNHDLGIAAISENSEIQFDIYPNPTSEKLYIQTESINGAKMKIVSITGALILEGVLQPEIDVANFKSGVYFIEILSNATIARKKFIKE
jgi:photosystem II stability/assembly factor-like uncharacterized protein